MRPPKHHHDRVTPEPWALLYEAVVAYVMKHRQEYGHDIADNPMLCRGVASILRGLEVLLDGEVGGLEPGRCWQNLDKFARFAGWSKGLEGASGLDTIRAAALLERDALRLLDEIDETSTDLTRWLDRDGEETDTELQITRALEIARVKILGGAAEAAVVADAPSVGAEPSASAEQHAASTGEDSTAGADGKERDTLTVPLISADEAKGREGRRSHFSPVSPTRSKVVSARAPEREADEDSFDTSPALTAGGRGS